MLIQITKSIKGELVTNQLIFLVNEKKEWLFVAEHFIYLHKPMQYKISI